MKQQKVASVPPPAPKPAPPRGPRYRYFSTTPATVTLRMRDLQIPEKARTPGYNSESFIDLPCADIFRGAVPKILLSRLAEIAPDSVTAKDLPDEGVKVCAARLALAYVVSEGREVLEEAPAPEPPTPPAAASALEEFAPPSPEAKKAPELSKEAGKIEPSEGKEIKLSPEAKAPEVPALEEKKPSAEPAKSPEPVAENKIPAPKPSIPPPSVAIPPPRVSSLAEGPASGAAQPPEAEAPAKKAEPEPEAPAPVPAKKPFSLFPMFRRKEASDNKPSIAVPRGRIEIPKPKRPPSPITETAPEEKPEVTPEPPALKEFKPPIPKPRFEPSKSFEPKIIPVSPVEPAAAATPPKETSDLPLPPEPAAAPETTSKIPAPAPEPAKEIPAPVEPFATPAAEIIPAPQATEPEAPKMPELPSFAPKGPLRFIERMRAAEAAAKKASVPAPEPEKKPEDDLFPKPVSAETPAEPDKKEDLPPAPPVAEIKPPAESELPPPPAPVVDLPPPPAPEIKLPEPAAPEAALPKEPEIFPPQAVLAEEKPIEAVPQPAPELVEVPPPSATSTVPAVLVETEHVAQKDAPPEIAEQDALQAIFLTEEFLSVDRVLELCGNLPGIHSCVLSQGASVIASHNAPDTVDIVSLSAHALEMLKAMRASSAKMGIGAVPAVTVHSEKGPITFFHQDDICLLVLHKDRGFIPGVREKLQNVVDELAKAKLPLRLGGGDGKKLLGK